MSINVTSNQLDALTATFTELEQLSGIMRPTEQQRNRISVLLAKQAMLRSGVTEQQINRANLARLLKEVGQSDLMPRERGSSINYDWAGRIKECRANSAGTQTINYTEPTEGGPLSPQSISDRCFETMKIYDQIFDPLFSNVIETETGANMPVPAFDDVSTSAVLVAENTNPAGGATDPEDTSIANTGNVQMGAYTFRSGMIVLSRELEMDSAFPWGALLERVFAKRLARGIGAYLVNGSGVAQPTGLITATIAKGGKVVVAAGSGSNDGTGVATNSVGSQDLVALFGAVDKAYRMRGVWYMSDASVLSIMGLLDKGGRPIVGLLNGLPFIFGCPICTCPSMHSIGDSGYPVIAFGDPDYFIQRRATGSTEIRRYTQKLGLAESFSVGYEQWMRVDSNLLAPNRSAVPFAILQQHS